MSGEAWGGELACTHVEGQGAMSPRIRGFRVSVFTTRSMKRIDQAWLTSPLPCAGKGRSATPEKREATMR